MPNPMQAPEGWVSNEIKIVAMTIGISCAIGAFIAVFEMLFY